MFYKSVILYEVKNLIFYLLRLFVTLRVTLKRLVRLIQYIFASNFFIRDNSPGPRKSVFNYLL